MKKIYSLAIIFLCTVTFGQTIYSENFGTPTASTLYPAYTTGTAPATFNNASPILYSGSGDVRVSTASSGYIGATGNGNVFLTNTAGRNLIIEGINTTSTTSANLVLSFGYLTSATATQLTVEQSSDGTTFTPITFTNNTTTAWTLVTIPGGTLLSTANLRLRFTQPSATASMRLDDVKITNFNPACTLVLAAETTACNATTIAIDTYTATIPFTGGGNATYTITTTTGTIAGNNPTSAATGNILINGIPEGTSPTVSVTGGSCNFTRIIASPECKPVNTLPLTDSFNYTVGSALTSQQLWSKLNTGDDLSVATGNLVYTGITSSGSSVSFVGSGAEARTPFTVVTAGSVYASFLSRTADIANITTDLANTYFAYFGTDNAGTTSNIRLWIRKNGTQFQYGLGTAAAATVWTTALYNVNDTQYLVLGYDIANNYLSLTVNPTIGGTTAPTLAVNLTAPATAIGSFVFRQDGDTTTPSLIIDELKISTTPDFTLNSDKFADISGLNIYPNPVSGNILNIETAANGTKAIIIFDVLGKQVLNITTDNTTVNISNLNAGVYIVKISEEGKTATRKLVVR